MDWMAYKQQHSFLTAPEVGKLKIKVLAEGLFHGSYIAILSLCPYMRERARHLLGVSFIKALIVLMIESPLKGHTSKHHHVGVRISA